MATPGLEHTSGRVNRPRPDPRRPVPHCEETDIDRPERQPEADQQPIAAVSRLILRLGSRFTQNRSTIETELAPLLLLD
jgi:hypothetical protein